MGNRTLEQGLLAIETVAYKLKYVGASPNAYEFASYPSPSRTLVKDYIYIHVECIAVPKIKLQL